MPKTTQSETTQSETTLASTTPQQQAFEQHSPGALPIHSAITALQM